MFERESKKEKMLETMKKQMEKKIVVKEPNTSRLTEEEKR
jgi:hypothetical protein